MGLLQRIEPYIRNGVVSLRGVKKSSYPLYKTLIHPDAALLLYGLELLNDVRKVRKLEEIRKFFKFTFQDTVDITYLRKNHFDLYKYLVEKGGVIETITSLGFQYKYSSRDLKLPSNIKSKAYHNKLYYTARKFGISVKELRRELGLEVVISKPQIEELRRAGFSYRKIAKYLNVDKQKVWRLINDKC